MHVCVHRCVCVYHVPFLHGNGHVASYSTAGLDRPLFNNPAWRASPPLVINSAGTNILAFGNMYGYVCSVYYNTQKYQVQSAHVLNLGISNLPFKGVPPSYLPTTPA